jgi:hypothetical protein
MRAIVVGAVLAAALGLTGCATASQEAVLGNLEHCDRTYIGQVGGVLPPSVSVSIRCNPRPYDAPAPQAEPAT